MEPWSDSGLARVDFGSLPLAVEGSKCSASNSARMAAELGFGYSSSSFVTETPFEWQGINFDL
jgi:hypothetical protein